MGKVWAQAPRKSHPDGFGKRGRKRLFGLRSSAVTVAGQNAAFGGADEIEEFDNFWKLWNFCESALDGVCRVQPLAEEDIVNFLDCVNRLVRESVSAEAHDVESADAAVASVADHERGEVDGDCGDSAQNRHASDAAELVNRNQP